MAAAIPGFVLYGPPRTKKTHSRIVTIPQAGTRPCPACGRRQGFPKLLPSEAFVEWEKSALQQCVGIKATLASRGVVLPLVGLVSIEALIYRQTAVGDVCGYQQAIGDTLEKAGILLNDAQIEDWDGTRRLKDALRPRVEIYITVVEERAVQEGLALAGGVEVK